MNWKGYTYPACVGLGIGVGSLAIPLLRDLHWESASLSALFCALYGGWVASGRPGHRLQNRWSLAAGLGLILGWALPLLAYAILTNCLSLAGVGYWLAGPVPSLIFGTAVGRVAAFPELRGKRFWTILILLLVASIPLLLQFFSYPQLYFFNHVWSYWPGPIYDEIVRFDSRLLLFRAETLFWATLLWLLPVVRNSRLVQGAVLLLAVALLWSFMNRSEWGFTVPESRLQSKLSHQVETEHFRVFYSPEIDDPGRISRLTALHEIYLQEITDTLSVSLQTYRLEKIHSYVYAGPVEKKRLTGAGQTSFVPVWLEQDQMHMTVSSVEPVLKHELVHVVAKQFGNWFGASSSIGLVEGLAVALSPERNDSTADRLVAGREPWPESVKIRDLLGPAGFYGSAGAVSYVVSGSFVSYLIREYPVGLLKEAYATADIEAAYGPATFEELVAEWHGHLSSIEVDAADRQRSQALFQTPSLFQKPCPRVESQRNLQALLVIPSHRSPELLPTNCFRG